MRSKETDPRRIAQRRKQIYLGKSTSGYSAYTTTIPKSKRRADLAFSKHPITPDPTEKCSKRRFDGKLRVWRRGIHSFEENVAEGGKVGGTAVIGVKNDAAPTAGPSSLTAPNSKSTSRKTKSACYDQHAAAVEAAIAADGKTKKESGARGLVATKDARNVHDKALALAKNSLDRPKSGYSVVVSGLSPIQEDVLSNRYSVNGATKATKGTNDAGATAKFETPRKKLGGKSALIRPGSSGKENFALSRSAKKRAAAESLRQLREANHSFATAANAALLDNVCTGGVCMLPDARDGLTSRGGGSNREPLGELRENVYALDAQRNAYKKLDDTHFDSSKKVTQQPPTSVKCRPLEEFLRMNDTTFVDANADLGGNLDAGYGTRAAHISGIGNSKLLPPKCARFNEGVCDLGAERCEYRHAVWTFAERVEYEGRRAFAENSRVLEQNSALLNRLREQDLLIADQSQEISALLDEVHRLRHSALRYRGTTLATPSRATTIAATALRRTPLRAASSRASFRATANVNAPPEELSLTPRRRCSIGLGGGGNKDANAAATERAIDSILYGNGILIPESASSTYEAIHANTRRAKGFGTRA